MKNSILVAVLVVFILALTITPQTALASQQHTVQPGESLWSIAQQYGVSLNQIQQANNIWHNQIQPGQTLSIPRSQSTTGSGGTRLSKTNQNIDALARLIYSEARGEPYLGQVAVGAVAINRVQSSQFPNTLMGVIYQPLAFEVVSNNQFYNSPNTTAYQAAREALNGHDPTGGALYFFNPAKVTNPYNWIWTRRESLRIGNHVFAM